MKFFKKVVTFFSAVWNALSWRKTDKKAKGAAESSKGADVDSNGLLEAENLFVDVPLQLPEAKELLDHELFHTDETPFAFAPIVAVNFGARLHREQITEDQSGEQVFELREQNRQSLSFFSEPDREDLKTQFTFTNHEKDEHDEEDVFRRCDGQELDKAGDNYVEVNQAQEEEIETLGDLPYPDHSISKEISKVQKDVPESTSTAVIQTSTEYGNVNRSQPSGLNDELKTQLPKELLKTTSNNHHCIIPKSKISLDLRDLCVGDEIHLFHHGCSMDNYPKDADEITINDESLEIELGDQLEDDDTAMWPVQSIEILSTTVNIPADTEILTSILVREEMPMGVSAPKSFAPLETVIEYDDKDSETSNSEGGLVAASISNVQNNTICNDCTSEYSTNYMVKSDSLVNFLPERDPNVVDDTQIPDELTYENPSTRVGEVQNASSEMPSIHVGENKIPLKIDGPLLKEDCLEEVMCTATGTRKLSGDHHVESGNESEKSINVPQEHNTKTVVNNFVFINEERSHTSIHPKATLVEALLHESKLSPISRELVRDVESGQEDRETTEDIDEMKAEETGRSISIFRNDMESPIVSDCGKNTKRNSSQMNQPENDDNEASFCRLDQLAIFHSLKEPREQLMPSKLGRELENVHVASEPSDLVSASRGMDQPHLIVEEESNPVQRFMVGSIDSSNFLNSPHWQAIPPLSESEAITKISDFDSTSREGIGCISEDSLDANAEEDLNGFHPFIDCSSYLFRIPEEIRIETSFNPCVGAVENCSLHTVRSLADSFTGSLFCESLRSIISQNTENDVLPSFSFSSVQGCCPSVLLQSCESTLSNNSVTSIMEEEKNCNSKSKDEDYLATEKFMNDVNTALNVSVLDQIQFQVDSHQNLFGRGDGSMPMNSRPTDPSENGDCVDTSKSDTLLRCFQGENRSINRSEFSLMDEDLGIESGGKPPVPMEDVTCNLEPETSALIHAMCREVLDHVLNIVPTADPTTGDHKEETTGMHINLRPNLDESVLSPIPERDLIVQNMMYLESVADQPVQIWSDSLTRDELKKNRNIVGVASLDEALGITEPFPAEYAPSMQIQPNLRRRMKLSEVNSAETLDSLSSSNPVGDGFGERNSTPLNEQDDRLKLIINNPEIMFPGNTTKLEEQASETILKMTTDEEFQASTSSIAPTDRIATDDDEQNEPGANSRSSTRKRRKRRKKRKN